MAGARVPTADSFDAGQSGLPSVSLQAPASPAAMAATLSEGSDQGDKLAQAGAGATSDALNLQDKITDQMNNVQVQQAMNNARQAALDLQTGKVDPATGMLIQPGYSQIKGQAALQRDSGVPLTQDFAGQYASQLSDISGQLGNDAQRRAFAAQTPSLQQSFTAGVQTHVMQQYQEYAQSVAKGALDIAQNNATTNWQDPDAVNQAVETAKTGVQTMLQGVNASGSGGEGASANAVVNAQQVTESAIRSKVIDTALENNNPQYALSYFNQYKNTLTADDILRVQGKMNQQVDQHVALGAVQQTTKDNLHLLAPTTSDRAYNLATTPGITNAFNVAIQAESGGQQFDKNGQPLTSSAGAVGIAQVEPSTGPEAAKLAGLPWDANKFANDKNYNYALGQAYFNKQVQDFGGVDKGFAAYNAGPQALADALDASKADGVPQNWLQYLPKETQAYVTKNTQALQMGGGVPQIPTKMDFVTQAIAPDKIGADPRPQVVQLARDQAEKQYDLMLSSRKEQGEQAVQQAQQALDLNGGSMTALSPNITAAVTQFAPEKMVDLYTYAKGITAPPTATNPQAYAHALDNPQAMAQMSEADFATWQKANIAPGRDQDRIASIRASALNGKTDDSVNAINTAALNSSVANRLQAAGIIKNPLDTQQAVIRKYIADDIYGQQQQVGHKFSPKEIDDRVTQLFSQPGVLQKGFMGFGNSLISANDIPDANKTAIVASYAKQGVKNPSDEQLVDLYLRGQNK